MITFSNVAYCYHFDGTGNTVALTDSSGSIVNAYAYDPFGAVLNQSETIPQLFKFVGQFGVMADPSGLYYMRARYYDPNVGRFISEDPIGFDGGDVNLYAYADSVGKPIFGKSPYYSTNLGKSFTVTDIRTNLYSYASNNPIMFIDPYGLRDWGMISGGAIAFANGAIVSGLGVYLVCAVVPFEGASIMGAPLVVHTLGLGGTLMATGAATGSVGIDLIIKGWNANDDSVSQAPSATTSCK